jgi:hypothetical protein
MKKKKKSSLHTLILIINNFVKYVLTDDTFLQQQKQKIYLFINKYIIVLFIQLKWNKKKTQKIRYIFEWIFDTLREIE